MIRHDGLTLTIVIPPRRSIFVILFLAAWLGAWYFGAISAIRDLISPTAGRERGFLLFWLALWSLGGGAAALTVLWQLFGREILELRPDALVHRHEIAGVGRSRVYELDHISALRLDPEAVFASTELRAKRWGNDWGLGGGPVVFDYGAKTIRCAAPLDEAEAKLIIERLREHQPRLSPSGAA